MPWERYNKRPPGPPQDLLWVTIQKDGHLVLSDPTAALLGTHAALFWNGKDRQIGIEPTTPEDRGGYAIRARGNVHNPPRIEGREFLARYGQDPQVLAGRYIAAWQQGRVVIALDAPTAPTGEDLWDKTIGSLEVAAALGITQQRVAQLARSYGVGQRVGKARRFTPIEVERLRDRATRPTRKNGRTDHD